MLNLSRASLLTALPEAAKAADAVIDLPMPLQHLVDKCGAAGFAGQVSNQRVQAGGRDACTMLMLSTGDCCHVSRRGVHRCCLELGLPASQPAGCTL